MTYLPQRPPPFRRQRSGMDWAGLAKAPSLLRGPLLGKELRVSSRRRRTYLLRAGYLLMLGLYAVLVWQAAVSSLGGAYQASRTAEAEIGRAHV